MPRKVSTGRVGGPVLGSLSTSTNTFSSVEPNANIIFAPDGTGVVQASSDIQTNAQSGIRFADSDSSNYVLLRAPSAVATNVTLTLPADDGTANQVLTTDGAGVLTFGDPGLSITNTVSDSNTFYPTLTTATSGTATGINVSNTKLNFVPQTGLLTTTAISVSTATINGGSINGTTIGASTAAAGTFTTVTETSSIEYKENVNPITNALDAVLQLAGVTYDRKDGSSRNEAGLIAEETAKVLPNLVTYKDNKPNGINYTKLSAYLIEAVKTLSEEIKVLKGNK